MLNKEHLFNDYLKLMLFHIVIAFAVFMYRPIGRLFFIVAVVYFLGRIILVPSKYKTKEVLFGCAYFVGAEVFFRMTKSGLSYDCLLYTSPSPRDS